MQDRIREFLNNWGKEINLPVFAGAGGLVIAFIVFGGIWTATARQVFDGRADTEHIARGVCGELGPSIA